MPLRRASVGYHLSVGFEDTMYALVLLGTVAGSLAPSCCACAASVATFTLATSAANATAGSTRAAASAQRHLAGTAGGVPPDKARVIRRATWGPPAIPIATRGVCGNRAASRSSSAYSARPAVARAASSLESSASAARCLRSHHDRGLNQKRHTCRHASH